jgi:hypothetical protein
LIFTCHFRQFPLATRGLEVWHGEFYKSSPLCALRLEEWSRDGQWANVMGDWSGATGDAGFGAEGGGDFLFGGPPVGTLDLGDAVADDVLGWVDAVEASGVASEELGLVVDG